MSEHCEGLAFIAGLFLGALSVAYAWAWHSRRKSFKSSQDDDNAEEGLR